MADPWFKFYATDWRSDPRLRMCSMAARGLWVEMICLMHEAHPYGHLLVNGHCPTDAQIGVLVGAAPDQITALLGELETAGVFSRTKDGVIYSRKMSRMAKKAATARNNGRKGGNPTLCKNTENKALDKGMVKGGDKTQKPEARSQSIGDANASLSHANETSQAVAAYNAAADRAGWPKVQRLTPQRSKKIRARLAECGGIGGWEVALRRAVDSDFICGRTANPWTGFGFDWLTKAANFTKLMEGNYDNRNRAPEQSDPALRAIFNAARSFEA